MPLTGQQHFPSQPLRRNGRNGNRGSDDPLGNGRHYPHRYGGGCGGPMAPGIGNGGPPDDHYGCCSDSSSSSEFVRQWRQDQCTQQHDQFE